MKDGRRALLRNPTENDIGDTLDFLYKSATESNFVYRSPEDCVKYTREREKQLFENINASTNNVMLVCIVEEKFVGTCQLVVKEKKKTRHRANIAIALLRDYWGLGIGSQMVDVMIHTAKQMEYVTQIEVKLIEGNCRGRAMYEKKGFRIIGVVPDGICLDDGTLLNEYTMILKL